MIGAGKRKSEWEKPNETGRNKTKWISKERGGGMLTGISGGYFLLFTKQTTDKGSFGKKDFTSIRQTQAVDGNTSCFVVLIPGGREQHQMERETMELTKQGVDPS